MREAKPWNSELVVMDRIPVKCPVCGTEVGVAGGIDLEHETFTIEKCPHCGASLNMQITAEAEAESQPTDELPLSNLEITIILKGLEVVREASYRLGNMSSMEEALCRSVNVICTVLGGEEMPPSTIKDLYIRAELADFYTIDGKEQLVGYLNQLITEERSRIAEDEDRRRSDSGGNPGS